MLAARAFFTITFRDRDIVFLPQPAHSLGDAFKMTFDGFPKKVPGVSHLKVLEVDPRTALDAEVKEWAKLNNEAGMDLIEDAKKFQEWLTSIPGFVCMLVCGRLFVCLLFVCSCFLFPLGTFLNYADAYRVPRHEKKRYRRSDGALLGGEPHR